MTAAERERLPNRRNAERTGIQLAKSTSSKGQVFTNRGKTEKPKTPATRAKQKLTRVPFVVSRLMEFCNQRELVNQTGHDVFEWALVVLKELVDNAIDTCEGRWHPGPKSAPIRQSSTRKGVARDDHTRRD
jgi:hypothetical protein